MTSYVMSCFSFHNVIGYHCRTMTVPCTPHPLPMDTARLESTEPGLETVWDLLRDRRSSKYWQVSEVGHLLKQMVFANTYLHIGG